MTGERKLSDKEKREYVNLVKKLGRSATDLSNTPFDFTLVKNMGPNGAAGVYLLRSFELMLSMGHNFEATVKQHEEMADIIRRTLMQFLQQTAPELDTASTFKGNPIIKKH